MTERHDPDRSVGHAQGQHQLTLHVTAEGIEFEFDGQASIAELIPMLKAVFGERGGMTAVEVVEVNTALAHTARRLEHLARADDRPARETQAIGN
jgi:hypothetical protein